MSEQPVIYWDGMSESGRMNGLNRIAQLEADLRAEKERAELFDDLWDWAKRWQAGRMANNDAQERGKANYAQIIIDAGKLNKELDQILKALSTSEETDGNAT